MRILNTKKKNSQLRGIIIGNIERLIRHLISAMNSKFPARKFKIYKRLFIIKANKNKKITIAACLGILLLNTIGGILWCPEVTFGVNTTTYPAMVQTLDNQTKINISRTNTASYYKSMYEESKQIVKELDSLTSKSEWTSADSALIQKKYNRLITVQKLLPNE